MTTPSAAPYPSRLLLAAVAVCSLALGAGITYTLARRGVAPAVATPAAASAAATDHAPAGHATAVAEATARGPQRVLISPARQQTIGVVIAVLVKINLCQLQIQFGDRWPVANLRFQLLDRRKGRGVSGAQPRFLRSIYGSNRLSPAS